MAVSDKTTERVGFHLSPDVIDRLHKLKGDRRGSTLSGLVEDALNDYLTRETQGQPSRKSDALLSA